MRPRVHPARRGVTIVELLAVVAVVALVLALMLPAVRHSGEAPRRSQCVSNLKQIALALHNYASDHGGFPPSTTVDARGRPLHSWRTLILPYIEQQALYATIDLTKPWDDPAHAAAASAQPGLYHCPSADLKPGFTTYLGIAAPGAAFHPTRPRPLDEFVDGTAHTAMVFEAEAAHAVPWMAPNDADEALIRNLSKISTDHPGGRNVGFADGSIRFVKTTVKDTIWQAWLTIAGAQGGPQEAY
jgi:prepilin-type processing-associated H-X9-DG protein